VWAHNSHLGNARATEMSERGELNVGQLVRERFGEKALLIGFSMYSGTMTAARDWDDPAERRRVRLGDARQLRGAFPRDFEEPGTLEQVARLASKWFTQHTGISRGNFRWSDDD
jgi:erythromycin esterase-like protein